MQLEFNIVHLNNQIESFEIWIEVNLFSHEILSVITIWKTYVESLMIIIYAKIETDGCINSHMGPH